jgi:hypothetical protein
MTGTKYRRNASLQGPTRNIAAIHKTSCFLRRGTSGRLKIKSLKVYKYRKEAKTEEANLFPS